MSKRAEIRRQQRALMKEMLSKADTSWRKMRNESGAKPISQKQKVQVVNNLLGAIRTAKNITKMDELAKMGLEIKEDTSDGTNAIV